MGRGREAGDEAIARWRIGVRGGLPDRYQCRPVCKRTMNSIEGIHEDYAGSKSSTQVKIRKEIVLMKHRLDKLKQPLCFLR